MAMHAHACGWEEEKRSIKVWSGEFFAGKDSLIDIHKRFFLSFISRKGKTQIFVQGKVCVCLTKVIY